VWLASGPRETHSAILSTGAHDARVVAERCFSMPPGPGQAQGLCRRTCMQGLGALQHGKQLPLPNGRTNSMQDTEVYRSTTGSIVGTAKGPPKESMLLQG